MTRTGLTLLVLAGFAAGQSFTSTPNVVVPDGGGATGNGAQDQIVVSGAPTNVQSVRVIVNFTHTWDADLDVFLTPPNGLPQIELFTDVGGSGDNFTNTSLTSTMDASINPANGAIASGTAPFTGIYTPEGLTDFNMIYGSDANGTWTLDAFDDVGVDQGTLDSWTLEFPTADVIVDPGPTQPMSPIFSGNDTVIGQFFVESLLGADVSAITLNLNPASTANPTDIANVRLYNDNGTTAGAFDGGDTPLGTAATNMSAPATFTFAAALDVSSPGVNLLVVADLSIVPGDAVGVEITLDTDVTATEPVISTTGFPVQTPVLGVFGPFVFTGNGTFNQDFEAGTQFNYEIVTAGPFFDENLAQSATSLLGVAYIADAATAPPLPSGGNLTANSGTNQAVLDFVNGSNQISAIDLFYDMSNLNATHTVTLNFAYADIGGDDHPEDVILLSRDDGATWEAVLFALPSSRPATYTQESVDLSAIIATLPGQNYTDQIVIRFQELDDAQSPNDGTAYDDIEVVVSGGIVGTPTASISGLTNFGSANVGVTSATSPATWTITNTGSTDLTVDGVSSLTPEFTLSGLPSFPQTVPQSGSMTFEVSYTPSVIGAQTGTIRVTSNTGGTPNTNSDTAVSGSGTPANAPNLAVLGNTAFLAPGVGLSDTQVWSLSNTGLQDLVVDSIDAISGATTDFTVSGASFPLTITNNQSVNVSVTYTSPATAPANAVIRIVSNTGGTPSTNTDIAVTAQTQGSGGRGFNNTPSSSGGGDGGNCAVRPETVAGPWALLLFAGLLVLARRRRLA